MARGILFSQMIPPKGEDERFNSWYETDHVPARTVLPHFERASRFAPIRTAGTPDYLAIYEVDDLQAFSTPGYRDLKSHPSAETTYMLDRVTGFTRYIAEEISDSGVSPCETKFLSVVAFAVPAEDTDRFENWYGSEHVPMLLESEDWLRVRRYKVVDGIGGSWTHIAIHELAALEAMDSPERARARRGPLREQFVSLPWFQESGRWMYESLSTHLANTRDEGREKGEE